MVKFRHRVKGAQKGTRVPKGMSSESNPSRRRHRDAAASVRAASRTPLVAVDDLPDSTAILHQLPIHSIEISGDTAADAAGVASSSMSSARSVMSDAALSHISAFTNCTNPTFASIHRVWKSGSNRQPEVLSVLAGVTEVVREAGSTESDTAYFAALLSSLEGSSAQLTPQRRSAVLFLLTLVLPRLSKEVLQKEFIRLSKVLQDHLLLGCSSDVDEKSATGILKGAVCAFGLVLRVQPASVWSSRDVRRQFVQLWPLCIHEKPCVRTMSRRVVRTLIVDPVTATAPGELHPAASDLGKCLAEQLDNMIDANGGSSEACRLLCLLEGIMHKLPNDSFKRITEAILKAFAFAEPMLKCAALQCLQRVLLREPCDAVLEPATLRQLILSLRSFAPPTSDTTVLVLWMQAVTESHVCLQSKESVRSHDILRQTLSAFVKLFELANINVADECVQALSRLIACCVQDDVEVAAWLLEQITNALSLPTATVWRHIFRVQMRLFESAGQALRGAELLASLRTLARLRESDTCAFRGDIDFAIGAAVRYVGADVVLQALPLGLDPDAATLPLEFRRSWLIPVLRVNLRNAPLSLFMRYFLPIAMKIYRRLPSLGAVAARLYATIQHQFWELLPAFLEQSRDLENTFPELAQVLGAALHERPDLRIVVMASIRAALRCAYQPDAPAPRVQLMARYAKNYFPILFNLFTADDDKAQVNAPPGSPLAVAVGARGYDVRGTRLNALETVRLYADAAPSDLLVNYIRSALDKIELSTASALPSSDGGDDGAMDDDQAARRKAEAEKMDLLKRSRIADLLSALVRAASYESLRDVLDAISSWFYFLERQKSKQRSTVRTAVLVPHPLQKKAYRILDEVMKRRSDPAIERLFVERRELIREALLRRAEDLAPPARAAWVSALRWEINATTELPELLNITDECFEPIVLVLDKSNGAHARQCASNALQDICRRLVTLSADQSLSPSNVLEPLMQQLFSISTDASQSVQIAALTIHSDADGTVASTSEGQSQAEKTTKQRRLERRAKREREEKEERDLQRARASMVALNIMAQKWVRVLNSLLISQLVAHACDRITDGRPVVRLLVIRLLRVLCSKMNDVSMIQFQELIATSLFEDQLTADITVKVRKANRLLLEVLVARVGAARLLAITDKLDWTKQIRNIEKRRRRKARDDAAAGLSSGTATSTAEEDEMDDGEATSIASSTRTAGADTILALLEDSDDEERDMDEQRLEQSMRGSRVGSVWLRDDDDLDLLDRRNMSARLTTTDPKAAAARRKRIEERKNKETFRVGKDGRLIIEDVDELTADSEQPSKRRRRDSDEESVDSHDDAGNEGKTTKQRRFAGGSRGNREIKTARRK